MRIVVVSLALLVASQAEAGPRCGTFDAASEAQHQAEIAANTSFDKAVKAANLKTVQLERVQWPGETSEKDQLQLTNQTIDGKALRVIAVGHADTGCGGGPSAELVQSGTTVYVVKRQPRYTKKKNVSVCGCDNRPLGGCPVAQELTSYGYVLPPNLSYGGEKTIAYDAVRVDITFVVDPKLKCERHYRK